MMGLPAANVVSIPAVIVLLLASVIPAMRHIRGSLLQYLLIASAQIDIMILGHKFAMHATQLALGARAALLPAVQPAT
jgi:hypothetical protein